MLLENIHGPEELKKLNRTELKTLADEIRQELISTVSRNGGHLASNLGVVELTIALHRCFHFPDDKLIFDVGHQSYVHKMITGRYQQFRSLRCYHGLSGFPRRSESKYDCFETGHASTAISAALGMARARDYRGEKYHVVALVGDGALTGGMCYEALNDAGNSQTPLIVVLNDNEMSIAPNVGALSKYLTSLRISAGWQDAKKKVRRIGRVPVIGQPVYRILHGSKKLLKSMLVKDQEVGFFEALGFQYYGPINGHDIDSLENAFLQVQKANSPCVIHVLTKKGQGYNQAEERPEAFHGTPPFYIETGDRIHAGDKPSNGHVMADALAEMCDRDSRIVAITAAMKLGTGLDHFAEKHPDRMIDVGIAEEHAVTMAAGLAAGGMRPYVAVYASFFQRCHDQMINDVSMQHLPVTFLLDRSGIGGEDGQTHHGLFDLASLLPVPGMTVLAPRQASELTAMLRWTLTQDGPVAIRYTKSSGKEDPVRKDEEFLPGRWKKLREGKDGMLLAVGSAAGIAMEAANWLENHDVQISVISCISLKPADEAMLGGLPAGIPLFTIEEHMRTGGFGQYLTGLCVDKGYPVPARCFAVPDCYIAHGDHASLLQDAMLTPEIIGGTILKMTGKADNGL